MDLDELYAKIKHIEDLEEIKKLQGKYQYWLFKQEYEKIVERCFAQKTPGVTMEASDSGAFKGIEGTRWFYNAPGGWTNYRDCRGWENGKKYMVFTRLYSRAYVGLGSLHD